MESTTEPSPWILEADDATFQSVAVERSRDVLVVVDFWAAWCQPCRMLGPILEQVAQDYDGKFVLVKVDTEKGPNIAGGFGVQSIPAVYAMRDGQLLDFFVGLLPEPQIRGWIDRLLPSPAEVLVSQARAVAETDAAAAEVYYREAMKLDPNLFAAPLALAELLLKQNRRDETQQVIDELEKRGYLEPEGEKIKSRLHLAAQAENVGDLDALRAAAANPKNLAARLKLAEALAAHGQHQEALETALGVVQIGKREFVEPARVLMVDLFRLLGDDHELVTEYRRKLSTSLY